MKFLHGKDNELDLEVTDYQFPNNFHEPYDANWLNVRVTTKHARGEWSKTEPCLLTWELIGLIDWIAGIAATPAPESKIDFMEPELAFEWFGGERSVMRIYLNYGLRPDWSPYHGPGEEPELFVECRLSPEELSSTATALRKITTRFPVRVKP